MKESASEMNIEELRNFSAAKRTELFQAWNTKTQASNASVSTTKTSWHLVDEYITSEQHENLPAARHGDTRTPVLWVKFSHRWLKDVVVARGYFDYDGGTWTSRLSSLEEGDSIGDVVAIAWAPIVTGERPWQGPMISKHEIDPG